MKRFLFKSLVVAAATVGLSLVAGCFQGPAGPAGKDGTSVLDTLLIKDTLVIKDTLLKKDTVLLKDSSFIRDSVFALAKCSQCHNSNQLIVSKQYDWEGSLHDTGSTWRGEGSNASCIACHNGNAFIFALTKADSANVLANPTNANCRTCHQIHTTYTDSDFALVGKEAIVKSKNDYTVSFPDMGAGNLCVNCHQLRTAFMADLIAGKGTESINPNVNILKTAVMVGTDSAKFTATAARASDHVGAQAQIISGIGIWLPNGGAAIPSSMHKTVVADGCVDCHLGPQKVHTYQPQIASCQAAACHGAFVAGPAGKFDIDSVQTKFLALAKEVRDSLMSRGIAKWDSTETWPNARGIVFNGKGKTYPIGVVGAYVNLQNVLWDGSKGAHNAKFTMGLLNGSLADLKK
ncbi:MAG: cytochrome c3 family protein [Chitinivibrionales bacterium]|nr:cytochrome c3 family protein [Chitinivibrionales bacterium]